MIKNSEVLTLAETKELLEKHEKKMKEQKEESQEKVESTLAYTKKFSKIAVTKAKQMKDEIKKLDILQLKSRHISKIADLMPVDAEDLHKITAGEDVSLGKNEIDKILEIVKKHSK